MTVQTFAVDADSIRRHYFPHLDSFSASTSPTLATVTERITRAAARLSGQLYMRNVDPTTIVDTTSPAWVWCQETLSLIVAIRLAQVVSGANSEAVKAWQADLTERFHVLSDSGEAALGGGADAFGLSESAGPTDFISELSLDVGDTSLASDVSPVLRRSDLL